MLDWSHKDVFHRDDESIGGMSLLSTSNPHPDIDVFGSCGYSRAVTHNRYIAALFAHRQHVIDAYACKVLEDF